MVLFIYGEFKQKLKYLLTRINVVKILTKQLLCEYKCKFDVRTCNSNHKWNNDDS